MRQDCVSNQPRILASCTRMHKKVFGLILLDQITKLIFWPRDFYISFVHVHPVKNFGLGFSLDFGVLGNLIVLGAALAFFIYYFFKHRMQMDFLGRIAFALILAGALSNIIDRLYLGYVRDFLDVGLGFTFNLADAIIVIGLILILFKSTKNEEYSWN